MKTVFRIASETYTEKAKRILAQNHIPYRMQKVTGAEGCTAKFTADAGSERVFSLLRSNGIQFRSDI